MTDKDHLDLFDKDRLVYLSPDSRNDLKRVILPTNEIIFFFHFYSTPPASKSPAPNMDLGAQDQQKNPKSEGLQWDLGILELDLRFRGGLGLSPIGLENFRGGLSPSPPLNLKSNSKILKSNWTWAKSTSKSQVQL